MYLGGDGSANSLLINSQVVLSVALPFAIFPLVHITSSADKMGVFVNNKIITVCAYITAMVILFLDVYLFAVP